MSSVLEFLFFAALAFIAYAYLLFPLLVLLRGALAPKPFSRGDITPPVTMVIAVHNEEKVIREKLHNVLGLDYPSDRLQVVVASDGSTDGTAAIVRQFPADRVRLLELSRVGKADALNAAVTEARGEILVFSDANSLFSPESLRALVGPFHDPGVGGVAGDQRYRSETSRGGAAGGETLYWDYDRVLKIAESRGGNVVSATGAIYAIRNSLFQRVPPGVTDDFFVSTGVIAAGRRLVFEPRATAHEATAPSSGAEFSRKVRIMTRGLWGVCVRRELLNPFRYGFYAVQLASHKIFRRLVVFPLLMLLALAPLLWSHGAIYRLAAVAQLLFYSLALLHLAARRTGLALARVFSLPFFFCAVNVAAFVAATNVLRGRRIDRWSPTARPNAGVRSEAGGARLGILIASLRQGGAERASLGLLDALVARGRDAHLITIDRNREMSLAADPERAAVLAGRIVNLSRSDITWGTIAKTILGPWHLWTLLQAVRRLRLEMVLSIMERANILNLLAPGRHKRVLSIRSYPSAMLSSKAPLKRFLIVRLYRTLLRRADRIVVVSREGAAEFGALFPEIASRIVVIYNACDADRIVKSGAEPFPEASLFDRPTIVSVGRLIRDKGQAQLLRAFAEVARRHPEAQLVIVGSGPLEAELLALRDALGLAGRVIFPGFRPNPMPWVARARAFVLPSLREGFPNALLEALALGVPAIAADCRSGPRELLAPGTDPTRKTHELEIGAHGLLVPPLDGIRRDATVPLSAQERILADAMIRLLEDDELHAHLSEQARKRATDFVPDRILPEWLGLLGDLANADSKRPCS